MSKECFQCAKHESRKGDPGSSTDRTILYYLCCAGWYCLKMFHHAAGRVDEISCECVLCVLGFCVFPYHNSISIEYMLTTFANGQAFPPSPGPDDLFTPSSCSDFFRGFFIIAVVVESNLQSPRLMTIFLRINGNEGIGNLGQQDQ